MSALPVTGVSRLLGFGLLLTLIFRFVLGAVFPITGDEAYFIWWGWRPDWGFYDHPPMIGWWLAALSVISHSELWLRLPIIVQPALLSGAVWWALPRIWPELDTTAGRLRRQAITLMVLLAPANVWNVFITTDTPLVYFSVLSAMAWLRAAQEREGDGLRWYLLCGLLLAGAVLSKYFVALLGFAYLIDTLRRRTRMAFAGLALCYACCVPALALMGWWNSSNCWPNYMFNFVNRHKANGGLSYTTPLLYVLSLVYLLTPPVIWFAGQRLLGRRPPRGCHPTTTDFALPTSPAIGSTATLAAVPLILFAALSLPKTIGLHWLLTFVPLVLIWLGMRLSDAQLIRLSRFFFAFALLHILIIAVVVRMPLETWKDSSAYPSLILTADSPALAGALAADRADTEKRWVLAMDGYSNAITLSYNLREYVAVFGEGSSHARHDDIMTDWRTFDGRNILVLRKTAPDEAEYTPYFRQIAIDSVEIRGARFWRIRGEGFNYPAYRDGVLSKIRQRFYRLPHWLPQNGCYFCDRYFPGEVCQK